MKRFWLLIAGVCALGGAVFTSGCGPGLIAAGGGSIGAIFGIQSGGKDKKKGGGGTAPSTNVIPAVVVTSLTREETPAAINFTILDANDDLCSIEVQYSTGSSFQPCFQGAGGDGVTGLTSSAGGATHTFSWDFDADLGPAVTQGLSVRIRANDGTTTGSWATLSGLSIGNEAPVMTNIQGSGTDVVLVTFDLADQNNDLGSIDLAYSIDQGQNFLPIDTDPMSAGYELIGNPPTNLLTSPSGSPGQFIWAAFLSVPDFVGDVLIRMQTKDQPSGYSMATPGSPVVAGPFTIDTSVNGPPSMQLLSNLDGLTFTGEVPLSITLQDDESNASVVVVEYNLNDGNGWQPATLVNQFAQSIAGPFPTSPSPTGYSIVWDCLADIGIVATYANYYPTVQLAMTPSDANPGNAVASDIFSIYGNEAPAVTDIQVLQDSGNVPIVITVQDGQSDPVGVDIAYSTDGTNYTALSASDFVFGNPASLVSTPIGEDNVLIWDTAIVFPTTNAASVTLRVTPTDHPPSATPTADLTGAAFTSSNFPIINDPSGAAPISIDIFTTDSGGTPNAVDDVTVVPGGTPPTNQRYFDRDVNPASATVTNTFWAILETGADYGQLLTPAGAALQYAQGSVTVSGSVVDGHTFQIDDGINGLATFEFDTNSAIAVGNVPVDILGLTTQDEFGQALAAAINGNPDVRIDATYAGTGVIQLKHEIACEIGNAASGGGNGNAADMTISAAAGTIGAQLSGGSGTQRVQYVAPATAPPSSSFVTLVCLIDDAGYYATVQKTYRLWWGDPPTSVAVTPPSGTLVVNTTQQFTASVTPASAPQFVIWEVVGGSANGTITNSGLYTAPSSVPASNPVTIRAYCVKPSVSPGTSSYTIKPEPTSVTVTPPADNPPSWVAPDLALGASITFTSAVLPAAAPQTVSWRIIWNSQDWGSGNTTVGTVNTSGTYTAPQSLPSPDTVRVDAVSTVKQTVFGSFFVHLVAPAPTSFSVSPTTASVYANGAGKQFTTPSASFVPSNANQAVTWEINPVIGGISSSGYYTPPTTLSTATVVTVTARSAVAPTVTANAILTVNPPQSTAPTSVSISPGEGITISRAQTSVPIQFSAVVFPAQASQSVSWQIISPAFGSINSSNGLYTPDPTDIDEVITVRATAMASPNPFDEVTVYIGGDGKNWVEIPNLSLGRGDTTAAWDPVNDRVWVLGGHSETSPVNHEDAPLFLETSSTTSLGAYDSITKNVGGLSKGMNCVMCACDESKDRLLAVVGQGATSNALIFELDLTNVTGASPATWQPVSTSNNNNAPKLGGTASYHTWWDSNAKELQILVGNNFVYILDTNNDSWQARRSTQQQSQAPTDPQLVAHAYDRNTQTHYFVGAANGTAAANNEVWYMPASDWKWRVLTQSGSVPSSGVQNASAYFHSGKIWMFGGREANKIGYNNDLYSIIVSTGSNTAAWTKITPTNERPMPRGDAAFVFTPLGDAWLYGGELPTVGTFGDLWYFDESAAEFYPENADNIRPQGRKSAAGTWEYGQGIIYGGLADHGPSNETWSVDYSGTAPTWYKHSATGSLPPAMWGSAMCLDDSDGVSILFGGDKAPAGAATPSLENEVWAFDSGNDTWTRLTPGGTRPSPRREAGICYDQDDKRIWIFGGYDGSTRLNDLWFLDISSGLPGTWQLATAISGSAPDARINATIGYDSRHKRILVCGGDSTVSGPNRQLFAFSVTSNSWSPLSVTNTGTEDDVNLSCGVYDDEYSRILHTPAARKKTQAIVMCTTGPTWQYMTDPPNNNTTAGTGLYDPSTGRYYALFGERTILSRPIGTNAFRTFVLK
ncbi:MAG: hypothetical protein KDB90_14975 [Planctomycetes bacterium]|nr:hypothetical protein [Planctomycetota bacterium]